MFVPYACGMVTPKAQAHSFAVWATAWGPMGAAAGAKGIRSIVLPHYRADELAELLAWEHGGAERDDAGSRFATLIDLSRRYFNGQSVDFTSVACELPSEKTFAGKVLRACRDIPYARTISYGELALRIGRSDAARAVAAALGKNPFPLVVPCHRVTYSDGRIGGFSAPGGTQLKQRMIAIEASLL